MPLVSKTELIEKAIASEVISFPTDTVPALAVLPKKSHLIFKIKKRPQTKPLILMAASVNQLWQYVKGTNEELKIWQAIAAKYLPGALTLVLPSSEKVPPELNPHDSTTIGIRVPNLPIAQEILSETGALATTSANISGKPPITNMQEIDKAFAEVFAIDYISLNNSLVPSTVIKWIENDWQVLRQGAVNFSSL